MFITSNKNQKFKNKIKKNGMVFSFGQNSLFNYLQHKVFISEKKYRRMVIVFPFLVFFCGFFFFVCLFVFLGLHLQHMEVPRLGV